MAKNNNGDGFILYNLNLDTGADHESRSSIPSQYSALSAGPSASQYSAGGSSAARQASARGARPAPPPQSAVLRTNFTTQAATQHTNFTSDNFSGDPESPAHNYRDYNTPLSGTVPGHDTDLARQFREVAILQQQQKQAAPSSTFTLIAIIISIIVGAFAGFALHHFGVDQTVIKWIRMPGDMYIRALQCVVVPLVFVNLAVSVADIVHLGQSKMIGYRVAAFFLSITVIAVIEGVGMGYLSSVVLNLSSTAKPSNKQAVFAIECSNGKFLQELSDGLVTCSASSANSSAQFVVNDMNNALMKNTVATSGGSLTVNLINLLHLVVPDNIMNAFVQNIQLSLVAFAIPCGAVLAKSFHGPIHLNPLLEFLREVNDTMLIMTNHVIRFTPLAVLSLLAGSFGENLDTLVSVSPIRMTLSVTALYFFAIIVHMLIVLPLIFVAITHSNPYAYMRHMIPAYVYSLGCSSSIATLPVSLNCVERTNQITDSVMYFVMSAGCSLNMNGTAIYLPMMVFFIVEISGLSGVFEVKHFVVLVLASLLGAFAASPVPAGSLLMVTTVWKITLPEYDMPEIYAFLVAADVILDRLVTCANINGDAMICRMVAEQVNEHITKIAQQPAPAHV
ncbi:TPA: hypothetical protein N0F65_007737 [Lagenidium giganteum]|uniref:Amino acid transporter n=1 Tax=Lagenidium giganteum TaxID=4803 RepID=A0AAV2Z0Y4_9STRA|nr:TPA: hypothetical protein N0F65_007737 [Lagenidium giganteum]